MRFESSEACLQTKLKYVDTEVLGGTGHIFITALLSRVPALDFGLQFFMYY